jgi:hypothetical protein
MWCAAHFVRSAAFQLRKSPDKTHFLWCWVRFAISVSLLAVTGSSEVVDYQSPVAGVSRCEYQETSDVWNRARIVKSFARPAGDERKWCGGCGIGAREARGV